MNKLIKELLKILSAKEISVYDTQNFMRKIDKRLLKYIIDPYYQEIILYDSQYNEITFYKKNNSIVISSDKPKIRTCTVETDDDLLEILKFILDNKTVKKEKVIKKNDLKATKINNIIQDYNAGFTCKQLGEKYSCTPSNITRILKANNIPTPYQKKNLYDIIKTSSI